MAEEFSFDWDVANTAHIARHEITAIEVEELFLNETIDIDFEVVNGEERWTSIGHTCQFRILVVVWTMREGSIRPVTAFEADRVLARQYLSVKGLD